MDETAPAPKGAWVPHHVAERGVGEPCEHPRVAWWWVFCVGSQNSEEVVPWVLVGGRERAGGCLPQRRVFEVQGMGFGCWG